MYTVLFHFTQIRHKIKSDIQGGTWHNNKCVKYYKTSWLIQLYRFLFLGFAGKMNFEATTANVLDTNQQIYYSVYCKGGNAWVIWDRKSMWLEFPQLIVLPRMEMQLFQAIRGAY